VPEVRRRPVLLSAGRSLNWLNMRRWIALIVFLVLLLIIARFVWPGFTAPPTDDQIQLMNNAGHSAAIVLDSKRVACEPDEVIRTTNTVAVGNVLAPAGCDSRVAVFVQDRAMHFAEAGAPWTDGLGDHLDISLAPMPQLPIAIWVPTGGTGDPKVHVAAAGPIYNNMQSGIGFEDEIPIVEAAGLVSLNGGCLNLGPVTAVGKTPGRLNVYYVQEITDFPDARGIYCGATSDVILISVEFGLTATLSHEIGHALTLEHIGSSADGAQAYTTTLGNIESNLMLQGGTNQKLLTTGQCFRCNLNSTSAINRLGARPGLTPGCHVTDKTDECPAVAFDVQPK
jgi:hypothetical protein